MTPQELQFELMKHASFNGFDGEKVVQSLLDHPELWQGALMDSASYDHDTGWHEHIELVKLRDLPHSWNVDTLYITPKKGHEDALYSLAQTWGADEVGWFTAEHAMSALGSYGLEERHNDKQVLRIWWD